MSLLLFFMWLHKLMIIFSSHIICRRNINIIVDSNILLFTLRAIKMLIFALFQVFLLIFFSNLPRISTWIKCPSWVEYCAMLSSISNNILNFLSSFSINRLNSTSNSYKLFWISSIIFFFAVIRDLINLPWNN